MTLDTNESCGCEVEQEKSEAAPAKSTIAQQKERLRAELSASANKVPAKVNSGSIQTTREWVAENEKIVLIAQGGKKRLSRRALAEMVAKTRQWYEAEAA